MINRLAYIHVMKTAGSYVNRYMARSLRQSVGTRWYNGWEAPERRPDRQKDWTREELEDICVGNDARAYVHNHSSSWDTDIVRRFHEAGWFTFAFYRHPGNQWCSFYSWSRERAVSKLTTDFTLDQFLQLGWSDDRRGAQFRAQLDLPEYWRELSYVAVFTEERFREFLHTYFWELQHNLPPERVNTSANRGYESYRNEGLISDDTHAMLLGSQRLKNFEELSESPWTGPSHTRHFASSTTTIQRGRPAAQTLRIGIYTTMYGLPWGGSEELWSQASDVLLSRGHDLRISAAHWRPPAPQLLDLQAKGARLDWRRRPKFAARMFRRVLKRTGLEHVPQKTWLARERPGFVLINLGYHLDEPGVAHACRVLRIPYVILVQAAGTQHWVHRSRLEAYRSAYLGAERCFFVSRDNLETVEGNLGALLERAEIVDNPVSNRLHGRLPWPSNGPIRIACLGRFHFQSKGQDLLVRVLRAPKWRGRDFTVHLFGEDQGNEQQLRDLIRVSGLDGKIVMEGFATDISELWSRHHALLMCSRYEGSSLSVVEAMCAGRVPIVTHVGRNAELVEDGRSGFIAAAPVAHLVDDALERAWQRRDEWPMIGARAAERLEKVYSKDPAGDFATALESAASDVLVGT